MRSIGMIGGMSWESTAVYYRRVNEQVRDRLGGLNSADVLMRSVNFHQIVTLQQSGRWDEAAAVLSEAARGLEQAGAGCLLICTNTMHKLAEPVQAAIGIPLIHIVDVTGDALVGAGAQRPLLLATRYSMEHGFYRDRLRQHCGLEAMVPEAEDRETVHAVIFNELCQGIARETSREAYRAIIRKAVAAGADSVILGCTEIGLLIGAEDSPVPVFDSTLLHADAAVAFALGAAASAQRAA